MWFLALLVSWGFFVLFFGVVLFCLVLFNLGVHNYLRGTLSAPGVGMRRGRIDIVAWKEGEG